MRFIKRSESATSLASNPAACRGEMHGSPKIRGESRYESGEAWKPAFSSR